MSAERPSSQQKTPRVPLGGDYWEADPGAPLWGFADLHAHLMAHLAFGGRAFWGEPYDPEHPGPEGMEHALASCEPIHGGLIDVNPEFGHPAGGGWPDFIVWPRFTTLVHQQAYIDWIYRAYQGGLRLITCLAVNNELLATKSDPDLPTDDKSAIERQVVAMKEMVAFVEAQSGGPGQRLAADRLLAGRGPPGHRREPAGHHPGRGSRFAGQLAAPGGPGRCCRRAMPTEARRADRRGAGLALRAGRAPDHAHPPDQQRLRRHGHLHAFPGDREHVCHRRALGGGGRLGIGRALPPGSRRRRRGRRSRSARWRSAGRKRDDESAQPDRPHAGRQRPVRGERRRRRCAAVMPTRAA